MALEGVDHGGDVGENVRGAELLVVDVLVLLRDGGVAQGLAGFYPLLDVVDHPVDALALFVHLLLVQLLGDLGEFQGLGGLVPLLELLLGELVLVRG